MRTHSAIAAMQLAVTSATPVTVTLECQNNLDAPPAGYTVSASQGAINAVQTASIG